jgi:hypothetical protein
MKNPAFEEEDEWRCVYLLKAHRELQFVPRSRGLVPVVEMKIGKPNPFVPLRENLPNDTVASFPDTLPIVSLWAGPGAASEISLLAGRALLEKFGYNGVHISSSKIPFRVS